MKVSAIAMKKHGILDRAHRYRNTLGRSATQLGPLTALVVGFIVLKEELQALADNNPILRFFL